MVTRKLSFLPKGKDSGGAATAVDETSTTTTTTTADDGKTPGFRVFSFLPKQAHGEAPSSHWHILPEATSPSHGNGPSLEEGTLTVAVGDRAQHSVAHSLPGAFPAGGTSSAFGAQMDIATIVDEEEPPDNATRANLDLNHGLVEARAIGDDDGGNHQNLIRAQEVVDPSASGKRNSPPYQLLLGIGLLFVAALGTVVGLYYWGVKKNSNSSSKETAAVTIAPTVYGSMEPYTVPSLAPSGVLDQLIDNLPDYTLANLNNGSDTPQWKAWQWLANHRNITNLPEWRKTQLFALATFFYSFEGENWIPVVKERWMDDTKEECLWFSSGFGFFQDGVYQRLDNSVPSCNEMGQFSNLNLRDLELPGLSPVIPPEILLLTSLTRIMMARNNMDVPFSDVVPSQLHQLTNFAELNFVNNNLQGTIPTELALITSMKEIRVGSITGTTSLFGPIPTELGMMTDLSVLWLTRSPLLTGTLPSEFGLLTEMEDLTFSSNSLSSSIPTEVGLLTNVLYFNLYGNLLTGSLPSELGLFSNLKGLFLSRNYLSGTLPSELGLLTDLEQLYLRGNDLSGSVPSELQMLLPDIYDHDLADLPLLTGVDP